MTAPSAILHPVVMNVTGEVLMLKAAEKNRALSIMAREALARSAQFSNFTLGHLEKDDQGAPIPANGMYWSISHADKYVAAVSGPGPVGIDIEEIAAFSPDLPEQIADLGEWALAQSIQPATFYRYWTGKEAVLKAVGVGLKGLSKCRITALVGENRMIVGFGHDAWIVQSSDDASGHVVSVASGDTEIEWHFID